MSTIAIGDIHGNLRALEDLLNSIVPHICSEDTVVFLGDYIDRGPDSKSCIEAILSFRNSFSGRVATLLGNHEQWLMRTYRDNTSHSWLLGMEAFETIRSYSRDAAEKLRQEAEREAPQLILDRVPLPYDIFFDAVPDKHKEFFKNLSIFYRTPDAVCVHGGLNPRIGRVEAQSHEDIIWGTDDFPERYEGIDSVVFGHTCDPVIDKNGWPYPRIVGRTFGIDTICKGVLTALKLPENIVIRSDRFS
jgi:serine/threonine protein phosphatase 1